MTIWLKLNAYIYGSQAFAKLFEQPSYMYSILIMQYYSADGSVLVFVIKKIKNESIMTLFLKKIPVYKL